MIALLVQLAGLAALVAADEEASGSGGVAGSGDVEGQQCDETSEHDVSRAPFIDTEASGFEAGKFTVVLQVDDLIDVNMCWFKDHKERVTVDGETDFLVSADREEELNTELPGDENYCKVPWYSQPDWDVLRPILSLMDVSTLAGADTNYRYESSVICETTESFKVGARDFTRTITQEMPFFIGVPDEVDVSVELTTRLTQPVEDVEVTAYRWTKLGEDSQPTESEKAGLIAQILAIIGAEEGVTAVSTDNVVSGFDYTVEVVPEVKSQLYNADRAPGEYHVAEITQDMLNQITEQLGVASETFEVTTSFSYFHPDAVITEVNSEAYRDDVSITIVILTSIERPWKFSFENADESDLIQENGVELTTDCADHTANLCDQVWTIQVDGGEVCDGPGDEEVAIELSVGVEADVHPGYGEFSETLAPFSVAFSISREQFACAVELAQDQLAASAEMTPYACPKHKYADKGNECDFAVEKSDWRTWETVYFQIAVQTNVELEIEATSLASLDLIQGEQDGPGFTTTRLVEANVGVTNIETPGDQNVADSVYEDIQRDGEDYAQKVEFSVLLNADLFAAFLSLEPVDISFAANVEIAYTAQEDNERRMRRRLLQASDVPEPAPEKGATITTSTHAETRLHPTQEELIIVVNAGGQHPPIGAGRGRGAPGYMGSRHSHSSSDGENHSNLILIIAGLALAAFVFCSAALMYLIWYPAENTKVARMQTLLESEHAVQ